MRTQSILNMRTTHPPRSALCAGLALVVPATVLVFATTLATTLAAAPSKKAAPAPKAPGIPESEVVHLPQYTVTDVRVLPPPEFWRYAELPGFEILSNGGNRSTLRFLKDFQQLQTAMSVVWPALVNARPNVPTLLILCSAGNSFRQFVPPSPEPDMYLTPTSLFVEDRERAAIVIDFMMQDVLGPDGSTYMVNDPYRQFYRQYTRFLMRRANNNKPFPGWLEEGLSRIFSTLDFGKKYIEFARVDGGFGGFASPSNVSTFSNFGAHGGFSRNGIFDDPFNSNGHHHDPFYAGGLRHDIGGYSGFGYMRGAPSSRFGYIMPLRDMLGDDRSKIRRGNWSAQCYAFVHMCLYGRNKKHQKGFLDFAARALAGPVDENDFKACFGRTHRQMEIELRGYVDFTDHQYVLFKAPRGTPGLPAPKPIELRDATQAEIGRIKGETLRLAGHPEDSREAFIIPYLRRERDPGLLASLGLLESLEGRDDRARKFLETAARMGVVRPRAYVELAQLRLAEVLETPAAPGGKLSAAQVARVLDPLFTARSQPPQMEEVYSLIGYTWLRSAATPAPANLEVLLEGAARFPRNTRIVLQAAELYARHGPPDTAGALIKLGIRVARDTDTKNHFEALRATLPVSQ
ncbi:MAG: hypothetical protein LBM04_13675 [Opitutaceae bacterium]|jgi:hypothetical protein|nr:hypothetical protein [Opitutaceae bacterium]